MIDILIEYYGNAKNIDLTRIEVSEVGDKLCLFGEDLGYTLPVYEYGSEHVFGDNFEYKDDDKKTCIGFLNNNSRGGDNK